MTSDVDSGTIRFSVIIPTYNRASSIRDLLNSFLVQSYKDFELIICDDGSTDNTSDVVSEFKNILDITYKVFENSGGPAYPRNRGIDISRNNWICFLDSDDLWASNKLEVLAEHIHRYNETIFCHPVYLINTKNELLGKIGNYKKGLFLDDFKSLLYNGSQVVNSSLCVKRSILTSEFYYNTDPVFHAIEDYIFLLKLTNSGHKIRMIPDALGYYRVHENNLSADLSKQILKWEWYFATRPFKDINYAKVDSLLLYIETGLDKYSNFEKALRYIKLVFSNENTIEIKKKSVFKLFLTVLASLGFDLKFKS